MRKRVRLSTEPLLILDRRNADFFYHKAVVIGLCVRTGEIIKPASIDYPLEICAFDIQRPNNMEIWFRLEVWYEWSGNNQSPPWHDLLIYDGQCRYNFLVSNAFKEFHCLPQGPDYIHGNPNVATHRLDASDKALLDATIEKWKKKVV